ncbi:STAS domain-containing protein [Candidatus Uabimicrobium sp. HlEnr_7]|uniref:STAS domain-containing protein n=1 Tax=Candidatus Uabimicrobium helgolandensis TaxID=3095367 RepID=UPI003557E598
MSLLSTEYKTQVKDNRDILIVLVSGVINQSTLILFDDVFCQLRKLRARYVVLNFAKITDIDSSGMGLLFKGLELLEEYSICEIVAGSGLQRMIDYMDHILLMTPPRLCKTEEEAVEKIVMTVM